MTRHRVDPDRPAVTRPTVALAVVIALLALAAGATAGLFDPRDRPTLPSVQRPGCVETSQVIAGRTWWSCAP